MPEHPLHKLLAKLRAKEKRQNDALQATRREIDSLVALDLFREQNDA